MEFGYFDVVTNGRYVVYDSWKSIQYVEIVHELTQSPLSPILHPTKIKKHPSI